MSSNSSNSFMNDCYHFERGTFISISIFVTKSILLIPLSIFVLLDGYQRWRQQHSCRAVSHSDVFSYHLATMELSSNFGYLLIYVSMWTKTSVVTRFGIFIGYIAFFGELFFHVLTCGERYLAVIHPITYRGLKDTNGIRSRNICIGCVWLLSFLMATLYMEVLFNHGIYLVYSTVISLLLVISFCSISVLCSLVRPGPVDRAGKKDGSDQARQRACYIISLVSTVVWLWFLGLLLFSFSSYAINNQETACLVKMSFGWLNVPSSLVSPLLYVKRAKKLDCCRAL